MSSEVRRLQERARLLRNRSTNVSRRTVGFLRNHSQERMVMSDRAQFHSLIPTVPSRRT